MAAMPKLHLRQAKAKIKNGADKQAGSQGVAGKWIGIPQSCAVVKNIARIIRAIQAIVSGKFFWGASIPRWPRQTEKAKAQHCRWEDLDLGAMKRGFGHEATENYSKLLAVKQG
ncbi:hypothetical protein QVA66_03415 [Staphylococcus chromogenes]|nr:hypothetical protein [Staphylococcus chromogenes]